MAKKNGCVYGICTTEIVLSRVQRQMFYQEPKWIEEMRLLANPWHARRRWQVELGFKLLAVARGETLTVTVTEG